MLKNALIYASFLLLFSVAGFTQEKQYPISDTKNTLLIADFDTWEDINNIGGAFSSWAKDPTDETQGCKAELTDSERVGDTGNSLKITYDVDSPKNAFDGIWMALENTDWTPYKYIVFSVKGSKEAGFTPRFKVEIKNKKGESGKYVLTGVTDQWKQFAIPLKSFRAITRFKDMQTFVLVFDDMRCDPKVGALFIDSIYLSK